MLNLNRLIQSTMVGSGNLIGQSSLHIVRTSKTTYLHDPFLQRASKLI